MRVFRRSIVGRDVPAGEDMVLGFCPIPAGGRLVRTWGRLHMIGPEGLDFVSVAGFGFSGQVLPILDPDTTMFVDNVWDQIVTKAVDPTVAAATVGAEFDWDDNDTRPELEPGELDIHRVLGLFRDPQEFLDPRFELVSWASGRQGGFNVGSNPDAYIPSVFKTFRSNRAIEVDVPSYAMVGVSSPSMDDSVTTETTISSPGEWAILENIDSALEDLWKIQTGLIESGAESPYAEITTLLEDLIAPPMFTESTSYFVGVTWKAVLECTWEIELQGRSNPSVLAGE